MSIHLQTHRYNNPWVDKVDDYPGRLFSSDEDIEQFVKNCPRPLNLELGSGSGNHIISRALENPDQSWLGFELRFKRSVRTIQKSIDQEAKNVFIAKTNAFDVEHLVPNNSVSSVYINFPDPWDKPRWHKHRLLSKAMLDILKDKLVSEGKLYVKTDHQEMFGQFHQILSGHSHFSTLEAVFGEAVQSPSSEFESLFVSQGLPICHLKAVKVPR